MGRWILAGAAMASVLSGTASAQSSYHWPVQATQAGPGVRTYFPMGTGLALRTRTEANTKQMKPGDRVYLEVAESLTYRGQIVVPVGAPVVGEVVRSERNGHFGKRGTIEMRLLYAETPFGPVRLSGGTAASGKQTTAWSIAGAAFVAWPLMFWHGTSGYIRQGTPLTGYLAEPLMFNAAPTVPQVATATSVQPDDARALPARFDQNVVSAATGPGFASR